MTGACSPSPSAVVPITRRRAGACVAGRLASPLLDWPAPDGPAASFPSAGVEAESLALKGGGGSALGGGGSTLGIQGLSGLFAGGWPLVMVNRAEISLGAWWGRSWERPFRACATRACARTAFGGAGAGVLGTGASEADAGTSAGGARLGGCVISIPRSGAHAAGGPTSMPPDEPAPDGPAASFPSAGVGAAAASSGPSAQGSCAVEPESKVMRQGVSTGGNAAREGGRDVCDGRGGVRPVVVRH